MAMPTPCWRAFPRRPFRQSQNADVLFNPTLERLTEGNEAFALRKGDPDSLNIFSNWIMINTSNGWLAQRWKYWFTTLDWADQVNLKK